MKIIMKTFLRNAIVFCALFILSCKNKSENKSNSTDTTITQYSLNNGVIDGMQSEKYENGNKKFEGLMKKGKREGEWFMYFENGAIWSRCNYVEDKKQGKSLVYLPNGNKAYEGLYEDDKPIGEWIYYNDDGSVLKKVTQK
jgi:antitoxin component YwqK of YwqJK toxin-antitoxin module